VSTAGDVSTSEASESTGSVCPDFVTCGDTFFQCGDGRDNDGDGLFDLDDPECVSACDDDEADFGLFLPGDSCTCLVDCYFDGNSGSGDDDCHDDVNCDPLEPGWCGCEFEPGPGCTEVEQSPECLAFCEPFVPNGCDCFGCCTFATPDGPVNLFLEIPGCSLANLDACPACTQQIEECGNPCEVDACEICIGQTEPAKGCAAPACVGGRACGSHCDCEPGEACITGCCVPPTPG